MPGIFCCSPLPSPMPLSRRRMRFDSFRCCSSTPDSSKNKDKPTPQLLKIAVSGATEFLRIFAPAAADDIDYKLGSCELDDGPPVSGIDDIVMILKSDYENAYFVTGFLDIGRLDLGLSSEELFHLIRLFIDEYPPQWHEMVGIGSVSEYVTDLSFLKDSNVILRLVNLNNLEEGVFTSAIYAEDCMFEDPTIKFRGKDLYSRNLKLLVPFFEQPSISLQGIEKVLSSQTECVLASWKLRTYLKLPWKPLISIEGTTVYDLDNQYKIIRHVESWNVSPLEAVGQIFRPSFERSVE